VARRLRFTHLRFAAAGEISSETRKADPRTTGTPSKDSPVQVCDQ
jgi:hypothetical protein